MEWVRIMIELYALIANPGAEIFLTGRFSYTVGLLISVLALFLSAL